MTDADVNAFLEEQGCLTRFSGLYTEESLKRKIRNEEARLDSVSSAGTQKQREAIGAQEDVLSDQQILQMLIDDMAEVSMLEPIEVIYAECIIRGMTISAAARHLGITRDALAWRWEKTRQKIISAIEQNPYFGWFWIYACEVRR